MRKHEQFEGDDWLKRYGNGQVPPEINGEDIGVAPDPEAGPKPDFDPRFRLKHFDDIKLVTAPNYLIKGVVPLGGLVVFWGPPKCGKSFFVLDLMMHVALGWKYRGRRTRQGVVVYLALEGGSGFHNRVGAWRQHHLAGHRGTVPFYLLCVPIDLIADHPKLIAAIKAQLGEQHVHAVVIDTLNRALNGDENAPADMARFVRATDAIRDSFGCTAGIVHHCGINGSRPRGHTSLPGADDAQIAVEYTTAGEVIAKVEHMRDGEAGAVIVSRLERVELGPDDDGDLMASCVIMPVDRAASTTSQKVKLSDNDKLALDALKKALVEAGERPAANNHIPQQGDIRVVGCDLWRRYFYAVKTGEGDTKKTAFRRGRERLQAAHIVGVWNDSVWLTGQGGH